VSFSSAHRNNAASVLPFGSSPFSILDSVEYEMPIRFAASRIFD
jgi:hypothetical protein